MFSFFHKDRFHESIACAVLFAASLTLHAMWILNLLVVRVSVIQSVMTLSSNIGAISGMYLFALLFFIALLIISALYWRGKDCSHHRKSLFRFLVFSTLVFFVMTLPFVYSFSVRIE